MLMLFLLAILFFDLFFPFYFTAVAGYREVLGKILMIVPFPGYITYSADYSR